MTEQIDLDALEAAARKATPGPWEFSPDDGSALDADAVVVLDEAGDEALTVTAWIEAKDAEFIAAVNPSTVLALVAELRQERERADGAELALQEQWYANDAVLKADLTRVQDALEAVTAERDELRKVTDDAIREAKREAWAEADLAHYPLVLAVEEFIHNGGDAFGNLDGPFDRVSGLKNPYADENATPVPELFPGVTDALDDLTIWKEQGDES